MGRSGRGLGAGIVQDGDHFSRLGVIFPEEKITASGLGPLARIDWSSVSILLLLFLPLFGAAPGGEGKGREEGVWWFSTYTIVHGSGLHSWSENVAPATWDHSCTSSRHRRKALSVGLSPPNRRRSSLGNAVLSYDL